MSSRGPRAGTDSQNPRSGSHGLRAEIGRWLTIFGILGAILSLALVHVSVLVLAQIYAIAREGPADHALADAAFLYWVFILAGVVVVPVALAAAAAGYTLFGRSQLSKLLAERVNAAPGRVLLGTSLLIVVPPAVAYEGTAVLGRARFGTVLALVAGCFVGGILLLATALTSIRSIRTNWL